MKRCLAALALACFLSASASAGDIPTVGVSSPTPPPTQTDPAAGEIPSVGLQEFATFTDAALGMVQTVWSLM